MQNYKRPVGLAGATGAQDGDSLKLTKRLDVIDALGPAVREEWQECEGWHEI